MHGKNTERQSKTNFSVNSSSSAEALKVENADKAFSVKILISGSFSRSAELEIVLKITVFLTEHSAFSIVFSAKTTLSQNTEQLNYVH